MAARTKWVGTRSTASRFCHLVRDAVERVPTGVIYAWLLLLGLGAQAQSDSPLERIPPLKPPRGEIPPSLWEQHHLALIGGALLLLAMAGVVVWVLTRPKPPVMTPPAEQARRQLEPLGRQPEDGMVLSHVSQVMRHYFTAAFGLPPGEFTTAEFCRSLIAHAEIGPALSVPLTNFLRQCDERKFSPGATGTPLGAVPRALQLLEQAEAKRRATAATTAALPVPTR